MLETLALLYLEEEPDFYDDKGRTRRRTRPLYALLLPSGEVSVFQERDPEDLDDARGSGLPLYRVRTDWDPEAKSYVPRLTPAGVTRISAA